MTESQSGFGQFWNLACQDISDSTTHRKVLNTILWAMNGTDVKEVQTNAAGQLIAGATDDSYTLGYDGSNQLTTVTRASDSKVITLTWTAGNLTAVSDWA